MRVLIAVGLGGIYSGGAHQALYQLRGLKAAGMDVMAVWGPDEENDPHGFDRLKALDIPFKILPINRRWTVASLKQFRKILLEFKPDVVECFKSGPQYHALFGGIGLNRHALLFYRGISVAMDVWQGLKYRMNRVDGIIANCNDLREIMIKSGKIPESKIDFVHGEFDPAFADMDAIDATGLKQELRIPEDAMLITQLGNWSLWRGQGVTLDAAKLLHDKGHKFHLLFCGRETDKLKERVEQLGLTDRVTLSLYRRDPERVLKITDILVNASTSHESLPGSVINGHAMGCPTIASDMPGSGEIIVKGETGFIVPPSNAKSLADALENMLTMDKDKFISMSKAARRRAETHFSSDVRTAKRLECYDKALRHRKKCTTD